MQSVMALRNLALMSWGLSVRRMRERGSGLDLDIFWVGSVNDMTRFAGAFEGVGGGVSDHPAVKDEGGSQISVTGSGKSVEAYTLLNFAARSLVSSRCCAWSSPTGTWVALFSHTQHPVNFL